MATITPYSIIYEKMMKDDLSDLFYLTTSDKTVTTNTVKISPPTAYDPPLRALCADDLDSPAGQATLDELADLWRTRWGPQWVRRSEIADAFYNVAATRLLAGGYLEAHELDDHTRVYRLQK